MAEYNAKIILSDKVWRQIDWFTRNWNQEIGALGLVKIKKEEKGEKYFYVEKLLFPKQKVTGATVHFDSSMWGELVKEHGLEGLKNIAFYWHRHPGSASHSGTDEEDTFETFMSPEANRPYFIFYQTAIKSGGDFDEEVRIEFRQPVRATLLNKNIDVFSEETPESKALQKECEDIIKNCVVKEVPTVFKYEKAINPNSTLGGYGVGNYVGNRRVEINPVMAAIGTLLSTIQKEDLGHLEKEEFVDNDKLGSHFTKVEEKVSMSFVNGNVVVICGDAFSLIMQDKLDANKKSELLSNVRTWKMEETKSHLSSYVLQPKFYYALKRDLLAEYIDFNRQINRVNGWDNLEYEDIVDLDGVQRILPKDEYLENGDFEDGYTYSESKDGLILKKYIKELKRKYYVIELEDESYAKIFNQNYESQIGDILVDKEGNTINVSVYGNKDIIGMIMELDEKFTVKDNLSDAVNESLDMIKADKTNKKKGG